MFPVSYREWNEGDVGYFELVVRARKDWWDKEPSVGSKLWLENQAREQDDAEVAESQANNGNLNLDDELDFDDISDFDEDSSLFRRKHNIGVFAHLPVVMQLRAVKKVAKKYDIDLSGVKVVIQHDPAFLKSDFLGAATPKRIDLFPNAFSSEETLARTLFHEMVHIMQFEQYGYQHVQNNSQYFEEDAYRKENDKFKEGE